MAELSIVYTLTTPGGTVQFNTGADVHRITNITGLSGAPRRITVEPMPQGHGGIVFPGKKGPRHITVDGEWRATSNLLTIRALVNGLENTLRAALDTIIDADGSWSWTPTGGSSRSLTVRNDQELQRRFQPDKPTIPAFIFGLVAANPDWS